MRSRTADEVGPRRDRLGWPTARGTRHGPHVLRTSVVVVTVLLGAIGCGESLDTGAEHDVTLRQADGGECLVWVATTPGGAHFESIEPPPTALHGRPIPGVLRIVSPRNAVFREVRTGASSSRWTSDVEVPMIQVETERFCGFGP